MSVTSDAITFFTNAPPTPPVPIRPAPGSHDTLTQARFEWLPAVDPDGDVLRHIVQVRDLMTGNLHEVTCRGPGDAACVLDLTLGRAYRWRVIVSDGISDVASEIVDFRTNSPPTAALPLEPRAGTHHTGREATFRWSPSLDPDQDPVSYRVEVFDQIAQEIVTGGCQPQTPTTCTMRLALGKPFAWRVIATDGSLTTASEWSQFRTNTPPDSPWVDPLLDGAEQIRLRFPVTWAPSRDADGDLITYSVKVENPEGVSRVYCSGISATTCEVGPFRSGRQYQLTITATDVYGLASSTTAKFTTRLPVVLIHGFRGSSETWSDLGPSLEAAGYEVLDFRRVLGTRYLQYAPDEVDKYIPDIAADIVAPMIENALTSNGYDRDQRIDIVGHSMGGLVGRVLIEKAGLSGRSSDSDWAVPTKWGLQVRTLIMVGTPNRGFDDSAVEFCPSWTDSWRKWRSACHQMRIGDPFLENFLGYAPLTGSAKYFAIGGKWKGKESDGLVPTSSPQLAGIPFVILENTCHSVAWPLSCVRGNAMPGNPAIASQVSGWLQ